jgi:hypothetical protein
LNELVSAMATAQDGDFFSGRERERWRERERLSKRKGSRVAFKFGGVGGSCRAWKTAPLLSSLFSTLSSPLVNKPNESFFKNITSLRVPGWPLQRYALGVVPRPSEINQHGLLVNIPPSQPDASQDIHRQTEIRLLEQSRDNLAHVICISRKLEVLETADAHPHRVVVPTAHRRPDVLKQRWLVCKKTLPDGLEIV